MRVHPAGGDVLFNSCFFSIPQESNAYRKVDWLWDKVGENAHRERADKARAENTEKEDNSYVPVLCIT